MNPQYMSYGGPQQGFPQNRGPPAPAPGGFQSVPLVPPKTGVPEQGAPRQFAPQPTPQYAPQQPLMNQPPSMRPPPSQLPPGQLPPSQHRPPNVNGPPPSQFNAQNGPEANVPPSSTPNQQFTAAAPMSAPPSLAYHNMKPEQGMPPVSAPQAQRPNKPPMPQNMMPTPGQVPQFPQSSPVTSPNMPPATSPHMPVQNKPPVSGQNVPPSSASMVPQRMPSAPMGTRLPGQPPMPGQVMPNQPMMPGQGIPNQPTMPGQGMPNPAGHAMPNQPLMPGQGMPNPPGHAMPNPPGHPMPNQPTMPGQGMPNPPGHGIPNQPTMPGPISNQPPLSGQPPMPGQYNNNYSQFRGASQPGGPYNQPPQQPQQNQFNQPPMPPMGQYNQLPNQMQGMNIGGPYPGGKAMNGDNGPHMPPPGAQQGYINGQQSRQGYPPLPLQQQMPVGGQYPQQPGYQQQQQQQQRRLDPDQMPSPIQVIQDDQANRSGIFHANQKGLVPPLVSTKFVVQDQGYCSPRYLRSTMYNVPITSDLMKQTAVPFGLVISPMARTMEGEYPPPLVNFGELGPVRCIRCKAYMCPYMQFIDSGRRFQCLFCKASTDVPAEYFQHLDHTGQRMDRYERPELVLGTYEFTATKDYCRNNVFPKPPAIVFVIDVSYNNVKSGLVHLICSEMKEIIKNLPTEDGQEKSNMRVGFITYNSTVHFYNIKGELAAPQMLVVGDTQEMFMPLLDGFLCTPEESEAVIDSLMEQIPNMFADTRECETILLPAIVAGLEALKASECTGKLLVFHSTLPAAEAPGKLKNRDDRKLLGTDKERTVLCPQTQAYNQLGQDCVGSGCSVDLFLFNNAYIDVATIGQVARVTGGEIYKYTYFQADLDGNRLINDIIININRPIAFDSIMRVRTSTGVRPTDFYGHCYMSNTTDMELASIDCDKAIAVEIKHDDKLQEEEGIYIQVALLYTSVSGQRRLRVINQALKTCSQMADLYRSCDLETIINFFSKQAVYKLFDNNPKAVKDNIVQRAAQMLANYRKNCASPSSAGQLILPECMKLLPLYVNCLLKSDALSGGSDMTLDDRSYVMQAVMTMDLPSSVAYFYPKLIPLHELRLSGDEAVNVPSPIRCTIEKMTDQGVYILENGIHMFLWIGLGANQEFVQQVFGVPSAVQVNIDSVVLPELNNALSEAVRSIIDQVRAQRHRYMRLTMVRQKEKLESVFKHFLVEDRGLDGSPGYVDFLCHMHKEIRSLLS